MENNKLLEIKNRLDNLPINEVINLRFDENVARTLNLVDIQAKAYENLFTSYINSTCEEANNLNLQSFLNEYSSLFLTRDNLMRLELVKVMGEENYKYIVNNKFTWTFDYIGNIIEIKKVRG